MVITCQRCGYESTLKSNVRIHLNKKVPCECTLNNISREQLLADLYDSSRNTIFCSKCPKSYTTKQGLLAHEQKHHTTKLVNPKLQKQKDETSEMKEMIKSLQKEMLDLKKMKSVQEENTTIKLQVVVPTFNQEEATIQREYVTLKRRENFYQSILEKIYHVTHKKLPCGETDITTDTFHAEIKEWNCYKEAIGQLVCYNSCDPRHELRVYLFGSYSKKMKDIALGIFKMQGMRPFEFIEEEDLVYISDMLSGKREAVHQTLLSIIH
jgi:hypothetical protein